MRKYFKRIICLFKIVITPRIIFYSATAIICFSFFVVVKPAHAKEKNTLAIMDFSSGNIPEKYKNIIRNEIEYNFYQAQDFKILEREKIEIVLREKSIKDIERQKRSIMVSVGKTLSADYVLTGDIGKGNKENSFIVKLRVINIDDGSVLYAYSQNLDKITNLKDFAKTVSNNVISDIKYYNAFGKVKTGEEKNTGKQIKPSSEMSDGKHRDFFFAVMPEYAQAFGAFSKKVDNGYGIRVYGGIRNLFTNGFEAGVETGIDKLERGDNYPGYFLFVPVLLNFRYSYFFYKSFFITPEIKTGAACLLFRCSDEEYKNDYSSSSIEPMSQAGFNLGIKLFEHINATISAGCGMIFERKNIMYFSVLNFGILINL